MDALGEELPDCSLTHDEIRQIDATIDRVKNSNEQFGWGPRRLVPGYIHKFCQEQ